MTVARDAVLESASFTTTTPHTFTFTPVGTPRGIVLGIVQTGSVTDTIDGTVSYGGVAMTRLPTVGFAVDSAGEAGSVFFYFLGSGIPTGAQTVSISHTGAATTKWAICASMTAAADTQIVTASRVQGDTSNPQIALDTSAVSSLRYAILFSGAQNLSDLTVLTGMEATSTATSIDFGNTLGVFGLQTTASTGSFAIGWTALTDDVALIAGAIQEVQAQTLAGSLFTKAPTFFTGVVTARYTLTGSLFTKAPSFFTGILTARYNLTGTLFTKAPTFNTGTVTTGAVALTGSLFTKAPTFFTGTIAATYSLTGTLFQKAPTFPQGAVTTGAITLTGTLFTNAPTFPTGVVTTTVSLTGVLFQKAPTFPTGTVTATVTLTGTLYVNTPTFPAGTIGQTGTIFGNLYVNTPVFFTGSLAQGGPSFWQPNPAGWTANPSAFVRVGRYGPSPWGAELSGQRFEKAPTFPVGTVT